MNKLEQRISDELTAIDLESRYDDFLDEIYPDCTVAGMNFCTSRAIKELDPIAYRCGMSDWESDEGFVEIDGDYYDQSECEKIRDELVSELESEVEDLETEIGEISVEFNESPEAAKDSQDQILSRQNAISDLEREIKEWKNYSF